MRGLVVVGILLVVMGIVAYVIPSTVYSDHDRITTDNTMHTQNTSVTIPSWAGGASVLAGVVMIIAGAAARPRYY